MIPNTARSILFVIACFNATSLLAQKIEGKRTVRVEDLSAQASLGRPNRWSMSKDGALALTIERPKNTRSPFLVPARDVWVQPAIGQPMVNLTNGMKDQSDWEGPLWSPHGTRLLMQSTRGGYRSLWVWETSTRQARQVTTRALGGDGALYDWVDDNRVFAVVLPEGVKPKGVEGVDDKEKMWNPAISGWNRLITGKEVTAVVFETGLAPTAAPRKVRDDEMREYVLIDLAKKNQAVVTPAFLPFRETLGQPLISPNGKYVAISRRAAAVSNGFNDVNGSLQIELRNMDGTVLKLDRPLPADELPMSPHWSPDGATLAFFAYGASRTKPPHLFRVHAAEGKLEELELSGLDGSPPLGGWKFARVEWNENGELVVQAAKVGSGTDTARRDWYHIPKAGAPRLLTESMPVVPEFTRLSRAGHLLGLAGGEMYRLDVEKGGAHNLTESFEPRVNTIAWPEGDYEIVRNFGRNFIVVREERPPTGVVIITVRDANTAGDTYYQVDTNTGTVTALQKATPDATVARMDPQLKSIVWTATGDKGTTIWRGAPGSTAPAKVMGINEWLGDIALSTDTIFDYTSLNGENLKGVLLLPLGYVPGRRYPVITSVYPGQTHARFYHKPSMEWQVAAAAGYAVLFPTMPGDCCKVRPGNERYDVYTDVPDGVLPALDKIVAMGIADPDRLFVEGGSMGGFATFSLVTQTNRFKGAIALAGISNWASGWGTFSAGGRYGDDIGELMIGWLGENLQPRPARATPYNDQAFFLRNSPISYVARVHTPLLIVHNDMDDNVPVGQSEEFFAALHRQGKRASFVRYLGEGHGIGSPPNIRDMWQRRIAWYDEFGDIARDASGGMLFENNHAQSRKGQAALAPAAYAKFSLFGSGGTGGTR